MKYLKLLGLAAIAATALMAFSAGSASADVLCKVAVNAAGECPTTNDYAANTVFNATSTNAKLTVTGSPIGVTSLSCTHSTATIETTSTGSNTPGVGVTGDVTDLIFGGTCTTNNGFTCTVSTTKGYTGTVKAINNSGTGEITVTGVGIKTLVNCASGFFKCEYEPTAAGVKLHIDPSATATITATEQALTLVGGSGCGTGAKWDATYHLVGPGPTALWVATKNV
jgi:hypothetical protein